MNKVFAACVLFATSVTLANAADLLRFDGGIGAQPLRAAGAANEVNDTPPGGRPWVIERLTARVLSDGRISVDGRGLLIAGGANIGTGAGQSVHARLYCGGVKIDSPTLVPLDANGDFRIDDQLPSAVPNPCASPILLIINAAGSWFAAGIPKN
jgi:hypothetical protein